jgi:hypothetical protein
MTPEQTFTLASTAAMVGWMLLVGAVLAPPGTARTRLLWGGGRLVPLLLSAAYLALLVWHWRSAPGGHFGSLDGVATLFASRGKLVGGWVHFLAFDLFIGRWMIDDVLARRAPRWQLLPCLPLTFLYGPAGLLLYFVLRLSHRLPSPSPMKEN